MTAPGGWTPAEIMAVEMSRHLADGEVAIMGAVSVLPMAACRLAQLRHAPRLSFIAGGSGAVNPRLHPVPESSCDEQLLHADAVLPLTDVVMLEGRGDVFDVFFAGGLQIDAHGNCNLQRIGDAAHTRLRGPGGVGLPFLPRAGRVVIYTMSHDTRTFVEKVDFVSGPATTVTGRGPALMVTPLCTMDFDVATARARLRTLHPGVTEAEVRSRTGFELPPSPALIETRAPTDQELQLLRRIDSSGVLRRAA
ncbi:MAG TPA: CoA-transferase [Candidatus Dormibacteraeota bacterium]|nr:CoA-transferase [Candidatus Dormibacteraeota bacterium]HEV2476597.1 CoA-transferase [Candidatus Dormibacteraeota bacterium]